MKKQLPGGVWPTMVTPFQTKGEIDYPALEKMISWYEDNGCTGLFAVCQSSESFFLSLRERAELGRFVKKQAGIPVVVSGHVSFGERDQREELLAMAETGADGLILISNRLGRAEEPDGVLLERLQRLVEALPEDLPLGIYECPYPYKRILGPELVQYCAQSGRFQFLKDTSCDLENIREKLRILKGSPMGLYNANTATLLESLRLGAAGYSGVMGNYHPWLYRWLLDHWESQPQKAELVQSLLTMCSFVELKNYPASAKEYLGMLGLPMEHVTRKNPRDLVTPTERLELRQLLLLSEELRRKLE